jgi:hypothetical protein
MLCEPRLSVVMRVRGEDIQPQEFTIRRRYASLKREESRKATTLLAAEASEGVIVF